MPASRFQLTRRVAFSETDAAGIVHFANFFRYMEDAEHAFLRHLGLRVHHDHEAGTSGFPRVSATCDYLAPLRFEDEFTIDLRVAGKTDKSITYAFTFTRADGNETIEVATGRLTVVYVTRPNATTPYRATRLPAAYDEQIVVDEEKDR